MSTDINQSEPAKRYVGVVEFSRLVSLSPFKVYRLVKEKKIPALKLGGYATHKAKILIDWRVAIAAMEKNFSIHRPNQ